MESRSSSARQNVWSRNSNLRPISSPNSFVNNSNTGSPLNRSTLLSRGSNISDLASTGVPKFSATQGMNNSRNTSRSRYTELGNKISGLDLSLAQQTKLRKEKQSKIDAISVEVQEVTHFLKRVEKNYGKMEKTMERIIATVNSEKNSRDVMEKALTNIVDERVGVVANLVDMERKEREGADELLQNRVQMIENSSNELIVQLDEQKKRTVDIENNVISKLKSRLANAEHKIENDRTRVNSDIKNLTNKLQSQISELQAGLRSERLNRDRFSESLKSDINRKLEDHQHQAEQQKKDVERQVRIALTPTKSSMAKLNQDIDAMNKQREADLIATEQSFTNRLHEIEQQITRQSHESDSQLQDKFKGLEDQVWKLSYQLEKEIEVRDKNDNHMDKAVSEERKAREEDSDQLYKLIDSLCQRLKDTMEE